MRWLLLLGCVCLIVYGTLYPFIEWRIPKDFPWLFAAAMRRDLSTPDILANILLYMPLGFLLGLGRRRGAMLLTPLAALLLSLCLETAQAFLPGRVASLLDIATNVFGAGLGVGLSASLSWFGVMIRRDTLARLRQDRVAWLGITTLAVWACAQLIPFVPSLDIGHFGGELRSLWHAVHGAQAVSWWRLCVYVAATGVLTVVGSSVLRTPRWSACASLVLLAILPLKVLVIGRQLSAEALFGTLIGVFIGALFWATSRRGALLLATMAVPCYITAQALQPGAMGSVTHPFNWVPLHAQIVQPVNGLANLADAVWPLLALACLCLRLSVRCLWYGVPLVVMFLFGVQWLQGWVPGRYPDITTVLAGAVAWVMAVAYAGDAAVDDG